MHGHRAWPSREVLQRLFAERGVTNARGAPLRLVAPAATKEPYEARVYREAAIEFREGTWHDFFNALTWLAYPRSKAALNDVHYRAMLAQSTQRAPREIAVSPRGPTRDALTLFDESGVIVASSESELLDDVREFRWKRLFWERRSRVRVSMRCRLLGHGLLEKALHPYIGMTGHAILIAVEADVIAAPLAEQIAELDARVAQCVRGLSAPHTLAPLPLLGVPGWWAENEEETFYDDARYFRAGRAKPGG